MTRPRPRVPRRPRRRRVLVALVVTVLDRAVMLSPRGIDVAIAAHEMSHVELHERLGRAPEQVPRWFDEGFAVLVADDRRYLAPAGTGDRCLVGPDGPLPVTLEQWLGAASARTYGMAACAVSRWLARFPDSRAAVADLENRLAAGERFGDVVG